MIMNKFNEKLLENPDKIPSSYKRCVLKPHDFLPTQLKDFTQTPFKTVIHFTTHCDNTRYFVYFDYKNRKGVNLTKLQFRKYFLEETRIWV